MPTPRDLTLPLPLPADLLAVLIVPLFLLHILFVNLMVGGALLTVIYEVVGLYLPRYDRLAKSIGETVTVTKSLAVVLGVGPLLVINLLYTTAWYSANALTGHAWILLLPMLTVAFLLAYLHKYTWDRWQGSRKYLHIATGLGAVVLFLAIPLIFLTNVNLMLFPSKWSEVQGFFSSLRVGNVFPRYFHFLGATLALTGLFLVFRFRRWGSRVPELLPGFDSAFLIRHFYRWTFFVTLAQFVAGPLLLFTLPPGGITPAMLLSIGIGVAVASGVLVMLRHEIRPSNARAGAMFWPISISFLIVVLGMGQGRHLYRAASLESFKAATRTRTAEFRTIEYGVNLALEKPKGAPVVVDYQVLFERTCSTCHRTNNATLAPSLSEVFSLYGDDIDGVVLWAQKPGRKRSQYGPMPAFGHLPAADLRALAGEMLKRGRNATTAQGPSKTEPGGGGTPSAPAP